MPTFVVLYTFTDEGIKKAKDTVKRSAEIRADAQRRGVTGVGQ